MNFLNVASDLTLCSSSALSNVSVFGSWTSRTPANLYPQQDVPEIRDSRLVPSLLGCLPSRTRDRSYPETPYPITPFQYYQYSNFFHYLIDRKSLILLCLLFIPKQEACDVYDVFCLYIKYPFL